MITEMKAGHLKDIDKPSEPFEVIGKIIPRYENENWTFTELLYEAPYLKSYQDEEDGKPVSYTHLTLPTTSRV